ncbi:trace amine-associated receptor 7c-like [Hydractinia symbiolongicarpus]|uniref:trace amine-associated receptor 7c-like n=1 Tax=Hydractinia symbiolongicarpus TaxID=13093 RepID=UPI00254D7E00|nr:trace amine-associated receptor 7c-like [Hydractinia symbiolongicarpus]
MAPVDDLAANETQYIINISLALVGLGLSLFILAIIYTKKIYRTNTGKLLSSLLLCDSITAMFMIILSSLIINQLHHKINFMNWYRHLVVFLWLTTTSVILSAFTLILISLERYIAVKYPYVYSTYVRSSHIEIAISCSWLLVFVYGASGMTLGLLGKEDGFEMSSYGWIIIVITSYIFLITCNTALFFIARSQLNSIASVALTTNNKYLKKHKTMLKEIKAAKVCFGVVLAFTITYTPKFVDAIIQLVTDKNYPNKWHAMIIGYGIVLNTILDPIIYALINKNLKRSITQIIPCCCCK